MRLLRALGYCPRFHFMGLGKGGVSCWVWGKGSLSTLIDGFKLHNPSFIDHVLSHDVLDFNQCTHNYA